MEMLGIGLVVLIIYWVCSGIDSAVDSIDSPNITFEEMCKTSSVITVTSWIGGTHATDEAGNRIRVERGFPNLISIAAKFGLYPTACDVDGGMMTLVKKN